MSARCPGRGRSDVRSPSYRCPHWSTHFPVVFLWTLGLMAITQTWLSKSGSMYVQGLVIACFFFIRERQQVRGMPSTMNSWVLSSTRVHTCICICLTWTLNITENRVQLREPGSPEHESGRCRLLAMYLGELIWFVLMLMSKGNDAYFISALLGVETQSESLGHKSVWCFFPHFTKSL